MGIMQCKKHGIGAITNVCRHVDEAFKVGIFNSYNESKYGALLICDSCLRSEAIDTPPKDEWDVYFDAIEKMENDLVLWCAECIAEVEVNYARSQGFGDPYAVYERTFTDNHQHQIDELRAYLLENHSFKPSRAPAASRQTEREALFIEAGNYRRVLTITIYYEAEIERQNNILNLLTQFFSSRALNQCRIMFMKAENWNESIKNIEGHKIPVARKGKEELIREVYLNCAD